MKRIVFSFDDGRKDTYTTAFRIIEEHGLTATINIASDFINNPFNYDSFASANGEPMSINDVLSVYRYGIEIACHGHKHKNDKDDLKTNIKCLKEWGISTNPIGFASPFSKITEKNMMGIDSLLSSGEIAYIRSGRQVRREGFFYSCFFFLMELTKSKLLFYLLNKRSLVCPRPSTFFYGITITKNTTVRQIKYLFKKMPNNFGAILIFHSILEKKSPSYGKDKWFWDADKFKQLCSYIKNENDIKCLTNMDLYNENNAL